MLKAVEAPKVSLKDILLNFFSFVLVSFSGGTSDSRR
jgi:hypothetical protein